MSKDESRITNNPQMMQQIAEQAKQTTYSDNTATTATIDKIDEMVTLLQTNGKEQEQGQKSYRHGNNKDYDEAVKQKY